MNWEAIGAVGELVGAAAVIITLLALVRQIRLTNNSLLATMTFGVLSEANSFNSTIGSDREAARLLEVAMNAPSDLAAGDHIQAQAIIRQIVNLAACGHYVKDSLPEGIWDSLKNSAGDLAMTPGGRQFLEANRSYFTQEFVDEVAPKSVETRFAGWGWQRSSTESG